MGITEEQFRAQVDALIDAVADDKAALIADTLADVADTLADVTDTLADVADRASATFGAARRTTVDYVAVSATAGTPLDLTGNWRELVADTGTYRLIGMYGERVTTRRGTRTILTPMVWTRSGPRSGWSTVGNGTAMDADETRATIEGFAANPTALAPFRSVRLVRVHS